MVFETNLNKLLIIRIYFRMNNNDISVLNINLFQPEAKRSDFYFNTLKEHLLKSHKHTEKPHRHDFYACKIFTKGNGIHEIDFQKYDVSAGSLFFMSPGQVHSWQLSEDTDGFIFLIHRNSLTFIMSMKN